MTDKSNRQVRLSEIEHVSYCPRQWGLISMESTFSDNVETTAGHLVHQRVDSGFSETRGLVRVERSLPVWSDTLGLYGIADAVEFHKDKPPLPVEYKSSRLKIRSAELQLMGQAVCLEEMFAVEISFGFLYLAKTKKRQKVNFDSGLRSELQEMIDKVRRLHASEFLPAPVNDKRCDRCSLARTCMPQLSQNRQKVGGKISSVWNAI